MQDNKIPALLTAIAGLGVLAFAAYNVPTAPQTPSAPPVRVFAPSHPHTTQPLPQSVTGSVGAGYNGVLAANAKVNMSLPAGKPTGTLYFQLARGNATCNAVDLRFTTTSKGLTTASGMALGYFFQPGKRAEAISVAFAFSQAPGSPGTITLSGVDFYTHTAVFSTGTLAVMSGALIISP